MLKNVLSFKKFIKNADLLSNKTSEWQVSHWQFIQTTFS